MYITVHLAPIVTTSLLFAMAVITSLLLMIVLTGTCYCAPGSYGFSGSFGFTNHLNTTGRGYGTLERKDLPEDSLGTVQWNRTAFGGGVVNYNDIFVGGTKSFEKSVDGTLMKGDGFIPTLTVNQSTTKHESKFLYGDEAKDWMVNNGANPKFFNSAASLDVSHISLLFCVLFVIKSMRINL